MEVLIFFMYAQKRAIFPKKKKNNFDHSLGFNRFILTSLLVFVCIHFTFNKHVCNGGKEEEPCFAFKIIHVFVRVF